MTPYLRFEDHCTVTGTIKVYSASDVQKGTLAWTSNAIYYTDSLYLKKYDMQTLTITNVYFASTNSITMMLDDGLDRVFYVQLASSDSVYTVDTTQSSPSLVLLLGNGNPADMTRPASAGSYSKTNIDVYATTWNFAGDAIWVFDRFRSMWKYTVSTDNLYYTSIYVDSGCAFINQISVTPSEVYVVAGCKNDVYLVDLTSFAAQIVSYHLFTSATANMVACQALNDNVVIYQNPNTERPVGRLRHFTGHFHRSDYKQFAPERIHDHADRQDQDVGHEAPLISEHPVCFGQLPGS